MRVRQPVVGIPEIRVRVEVHEPERAMDAGKRTQLGERHRVIAAHGDADDPGFSKRRDELLDTSKRLLDVSRCGRRIAVVDCRERSEHLHLLHGVVRTDHPGRGPDGFGAGSSSAAKRRAAIPRQPVDGGFHSGQFLHRRKTRVRARLWNRGASRAFQGWYIRHLRIDRRAGEATTAMVDEQLA